MQIKELLARVMMMLSEAAFLALSAAHVMTFLPTNGPLLNALQWAALVIVVPAIPLIMLLSTNNRLRALRFGAPFIEQFRPRHWLALWSEVVGKDDALWSGIALILLGIYGVFTRFYRGDYPTRLRAGEISSDWNYVHMMTAALLVPCFFCIMGWRHAARQISSPPEG